MDPPIWHLRNTALENCDSLDILGTNFNKLGDAKGHVSNRISSCRRRKYSLVSAGMCYGGLNTSAKSYLWTSMCAPSLTYNCEAINLRSTDITSMEKFQGGCVNQMMCVGKRSHHSNLVCAMDIPSVKHLIMNKALSLYNNLFLVDSPLRDINMVFLNEFCLNNRLYSGTLINNLVNNGFSPVKCAYIKGKDITRHGCVTAGVVDSIRTLIYSENYVKPLYEEYIMTGLLTKSF